MEEEAVVVATRQETSTRCCAIRGGRWLPQEELEAHLAALIRLENVGVLLGAGASMGPLGGLAMAQIWKQFVETYSASAKWLREERFVTDGENPDVEQLADQLEIARLEWQRAGREELAKLEAARADLQRAVLRAAILKEDWWKNPSLAMDDSAALSAHRRLLKRLTAARQPGQPSPWVFTTNYDLAIEWAAETAGLKVVNGFDGLHYRAFSPHNFDLGYRNMLTRGEARFGTYNIYLAKLHGSLSWYTTDDGLAEGPSSFRWPKMESFLAGKETAPPGFLVFPSAAKYVQTVGFVLGELLRRFTEFLSRPHTCLVTNGFSFSDEHLNRILISALLNPTLQLVLYLPRATRNGDELDVSQCGRWVQRIAARQSPQVTIVGGGAEAYFSSFVEHLPDPVIYDAQAAEIKKMIREYGEGDSPAAGNDDGDAL